MDTSVYRIPYYVSSTDGSDNYTGLSPLTPWKSLAKVNASLGALSASDGILFKRGDTFDGSIFMNKSGDSSTYPFVFGAYGTGEKPVINGFTTLSSWTNVSNGIYYCSFTCDSSHLEMVTIDGSQYGMGRWPNDGSEWNTIKSRVNYVSITDGSTLNSAVKNWTGAEIVIRKSVGYENRRHAITSQDVSTIYYSDESPGYTTTVGYGYFIQNDLSTLDVFGEWYYNHSLNRLYIYFGDDDPSSHIIKASSINYLYQFPSDKYYVTIDNIKFQGSNKSAISMRYQRYATIQNCNFNFIGWSAIEGFSCSSTYVLNNIIDRCNDYGVRLTSYYSNDAYVRYNIISNIGLIYGIGSTSVQGNGIFALQNTSDGTTSRTAQIEYNNITNVGFNGISFGANNTNVRYNYINGCCLRKDDGAGIYTGNLKVSTIEKNIIVNCLGTTGLLYGKPYSSSPAAAGIYDDYGSLKLTTIKDNTIITTNWTGIHIHGNPSNNIYGNTIYDCSLQCLRIFVTTSAEWSSLIRNTNVSDNIFIGTGKSSASLVNSYMYLLDSCVNDFAQWGKFDNNIFVKPLDSSGDIICLTNWQGGDPTIPGYITFEEWKSLYSQDIHSTYSNKTVNSKSNILAYYNASIGTYKTVTLPLASYSDLDGSIYYGSADISSFSSLILFPDSSIYYVKNNGSDNYSGLSDELAWEHHPWMTGWTGTTVLQAGDTVCMKRGDTWSISNPTTHFMTIIQSGTLGNPITTTAYGVSASKPIIQISTNSNYSVISAPGKSFITLDSLDIKHYSYLYNSDFAQSGIVFYEDGSNVPHDWIITNCEIHNIPSAGILCYNDSYNITIGDLSANTCANASSYSNHIYNCGYSGITLCGRDPSTNESNFNVYYNYVHDIDYGGSSLRNAYAISFGTGANSDGHPNNCTAKYNRVENVINWAGLDCHGGTYIYFLDNYVYNCYISIGTQAAYRIDLPTPLLNNLYVERNILENPGNHPISNYHFFQVAGEDTVNHPEDCFIRDNIFFYTSRPTLESGSYGIHAESITGLTIEGNTFYNGPLNICTGAIQIGQSGYVTENVVIRNNYIKDWFGSIYIQSAAINGKVDIYDNIIYNSGNAGSPIYAATGTISGTLNMYNNTMLCAKDVSYPYVVDLYRMSVSENAFVSFNNNILAFLPTYTGGTYIRVPNTIQGTLDVDYNLYWNSTKSTPFYSNSAERSWAQWKTAGYDTHGIGPNIDPLFVNDSSYSTDTDFMLQSDSSAVYKGTYVGLSKDYRYLDWNNPPSIGAYEYTDNSVYYVKNDGSDNYSGLSDASAWEHHPWMTGWTGTTVLQAGDTVCMKRGDTWSISNPTTHFMTVAQNGSTNKYITTTDYGSGNKPILSIDTSCPYYVISGGNYRSYIKFDNLEIKHCSSSFNINGGIGIAFGGNAQNIPHDWVITNCDIHNCPAIGIYGWTNSYNITIGDTSATYTATDASHSNHIYDCGYAGIDLVGCGYDVSVSNFYVYFNYIHDIVGTVLYSANAYGLAMNSGATSNGPVKNVYVRYNFVEDIPTWEGLDTHGGSYVYFQHNHVKNCCAGIATQTENGYRDGLEYVYVDHNIIENDPNSNNFYFIQMQATGDVGPNNCYIGYNDCYFTSLQTTGGGYGIRASNTTNTIIENNYVYGGFGPSWIGALYVSPSDNTVIRNNFLLDNDNAIYYYSSRSYGTFKIYNNIICVNQDISASSIYFDTYTNYGNIQVYNNTLLTNFGADAIIYAYPLTINTGAVLSIKNNILGFSETNSVGKYISSPGTVNGSLNIDYNLFWNSTSASPFTLAGTTKSWANWLSAGYDTHSIGSNINPLFMNDSSYSIDTDFMLQSDSSAIHAGTYVGLLTAYDGSLWNNPPSMGAYEYSFGNIYYVKSDGSDNFSGLSDEAAWQTVSKVNSNMSNFRGGDSILFNRGDTFYGSLAIMKSGSEGYPITFGAYGTGAQPIITGFTDISSWTPYNSSIYYKSISLNSSSYIITTVNGVNTPMGRYPNASEAWLRADKDGTTTTLTDGSLNSAITNWVGAEAVLKVQDYTIERVVITNHNVSTLTYSPPTTYLLESGRGYFIQNDVRTLSRLGDWAYDSSASKFYMYFGSSSTNDYTVKVSSLVNGVSINSYDYITFSDIHFTGFGGDGFNIVDSSGLTIQDCSISFCGECGIEGYDETSGISSSCLIDRNTIREVNNNAIVLSDQFKSVKISNNLLYNIGLIPGAVHKEKNYEAAYRGISVDRAAQDRNTIIENNRLINIGYCAIPVRPDLNTQITVQFNYINGHCLILSDGGGIYTYDELGETDASTRTYIRYNIVLNGTGNGDGGAQKYCNGLYIDGFSRGAHVEHNISAYNYKSNFFCNGNKEGIVKNNTIFDGTWNFYVSKFSNLYDHLTDMHENLCISSNLIFAKSGQYSSMYTGAGELSSTVVQNHNLYARPKDANLSFYYWDTSGGVQNYWGFSRWQASTGLDIDSSQLISRISSDQTIEFYYNDSCVNKVVANLSVPMVDAYGNSYPVGDLSLDPWTSVILMQDISRGTVYYVKSDGSDNFNGLSDGSAWQSMSKVNSYMSGFKGGDYILFNRGDEFYGSITLAKSGSDGYPITFGAYGTGEQPILTSMYNISGTWTQDISNIWYKDVSTSQDIRFLSIDGVFKEMGKWPNNSSTYAITASDTGKLYIEDNVNLVQADNYWNGGEAVIRTTHYTIERRDISTFSSNRLNLTAVLNNQPDISFGYFIQNHKGCLDGNGDWMWDSSLKRIYLYYNTNPSTLTVKVSLYDAAIYANPYKYIEIKDLNIKGYNGLYGAIRYQNTLGSNIEDCSISYALNGLYSWNSSDMTICGNTIMYCNNALFIDCNTTYAPNIIERNKVYYCGLNTGLDTDVGRGIYSTGPYSIIRYNDVNYTGHDGIFAASSYILVEKNRVRNFCQVADDGGGIYTAATTGVTCQYNFIECGDGQGAMEAWHLSSTDYYQSAGVYYDTNCVSGNINHNLCAGSRLNYQSNSPRSTRWTNNWSCKSQSYSTYVYAGGAEWQTAKPSIGVSVSSNVIENNVFVTNHNEYIYRTYPYSLGDIESNNTFDNNYLLNPTGNATGYETIIAYRNGPGWMTLTQWKADYGGENEKGNAISWSSAYTNTTRLDFVTYDFNFSDTSRNYDMSTGWTYYDVDGSLVTSYELSPYEGAILFKINNYDLSVYTTPTVTTSAITDISVYTAIGGGNVTHDGSVALTYRGICWGTSENPTVSDSSTTDSSTGEGSYVSYLTSLSASTHYYVRAFAYNSVGTAYGIDVSFNTLAAPTPPTVDTSIKTIRAFGKLLRYRGKIVKFPG